MISQHWFTSCTVKQQVITWTNVDHVLCWHCFTEPPWNKMSRIKLVLISVMFNRQMMRGLHFRFFLTNKDQELFRRGIKISHNRLDVVTLMTVTSLWIAPVQRVHLWDGEGWVLFTAVTIDQNRDMDYPFTRTHSIKRHTILIWIRSLAFNNWRTVEFYLSTMITLKSQLIYACLWLFCCLSPRLSVPWFLRTESICSVAFDAKHNLYSIHYILVLSVQK